MLNVVDFVSIQSLSQMGRKPVRKEEYTMERIFIQIAIGLAPVAVFFLLSGLLAKKHKSRNYISFAVFIAAIGLLTVPQLVSQIQERSDLKNHERLSLVYAIADEGSVDIAQTLLQDLREDYIPEYALAAARLSFQSKDYSIAKALYLKSVEMYPEVASELDAVIAMCDAETTYYSLTTDSDVSSIYATRLKTLSAASNEISEAIEKAVTETDDNSYSKLAKYVVYVEEAHKKYLIDYEIDFAEAQKQLKKFDKFLEENPAFLEITQVRIARLKLQILCDDYKAIAKAVSEDSDYNELLIVSELYLNNYVNQSDFSREFSKENTKKYQMVYDKLDDVYNNSYLDKSREERKEAKSQLKALKTIIKNPALGKMEEGLLEYATEEYALDASKAYLQMAKIEHSLGNEAKYVEFIDRSIDTVGNCDDSNYTVPMYELVGIIGDKDNPERLKDVAVYVEQVLDNNMTFKMNETSVAENDSKEEDSLVGDFSTQLQTYVSQKRMSVNIVNVDTTDFEDGNTIKATVNISNSLYTSADKLKAAMSVNDCGIDIEDFTVEKVDYTSANILLCVDTSGSMQGRKIENLKNAIQLFAADKAGIENIALVTFNSGISGDYPFGLSVDELISATDSISASGGTDVYGSIIYSHNKFTKGPGVINSMIVMTDGQDNYPASIDEIEEYIGKPFKVNGITVYTIGFGNDADGSYLNLIAAATGGTYLYASDPTASSQVNQLEEFFSGLRAQILNQYTITFKAVDTLSYSRELKVSVGESLDSDRVTYYLGGGADSITEPATDEDSPAFMSGKTIYGFEPRLLFKNGKTLNAVLKGEGFSADDNISVGLKGNTTKVEWDLGTAYIDGNSVSVTIPAGIGVDVYDVYVTINGKMAVLQKGISIFKQGSEQATDFGQYRFTSYTKQTDGNRIHLSGHVTMNGWLSFNSDVTLTGDLSDDNILLSENDGSYVDYNTINSAGLAKILANAGMNAELPELGTVTLHKGSGDKDPEVAVTPISMLDLGIYFGFSGVECKLYPNRIEFNANKAEANFPMGKQILKNSLLKLFEIPDIESTGITISSSNIGFKLDIEHSDKKNNYSPMNFGNMPIYVSPNDTEVHIDTYKNNYEFKFTVKVAFIDGDGFGISAKWDSPDDGDTLNKHNNGLVPTQVKLYADFDVNTIVAGIPITYSKFVAGIEDIDTSKSPVYWTLVGGCNISAAKLTALKSLTSLSDYLGDVSVMELSGAKLTLNFGKGLLTASSKLKLLGGIDCGSIDVKMGKFPYKSSLLGMDNEPVSGLTARLEIGPTWKMEHGLYKINLTIRGSGELDAINKFIGAQFGGHFNAVFKLWIVQVSSGKINGEIAVGFRRVSDGSTAFVIRSSPWNADLTWPKNMAGKL